MPQATSAYLNARRRSLAQALADVKDTPADTPAARELRRQLEIAFPPPARPADEIADRGTVRLGDANVTAEVR